MNVPKTFGIRSILKNTRLDLVIELVDLDDVKDTIERLGDNFKEYEVLGRKVPLMQIPLAKGRSLLAIIESAVTVYKHKKYEDYSASEELRDNITKHNSEK